MSKNFRYSAVPICFKQMLELPISKAMSRIVNERREISKVHGNYVCEAELKSWIKLVVVTTFDVHAVHSLAQPCYLLYNGRCCVVSLVGCIANDISSTSTKSTVSRRHAYSS